jgi:hypothetical protein
VKDFNGHVIKTLETEEELKKKKLANIVNGLREATDEALKLRATLTDQVYTFDLIFFIFLFALYM